MNSDVHEQELRDYFAAHALMGLLANPSCEASNESITRIAYSCADMMLSERAKYTKKERGT